MEQELTLHTLKPLLLQSDAENCSDALFLKKLFYHIVDESVIQKKLICKSASSLKAFMQGNRRRIAKKNISARRPRPIVPK